MNLITAQSLLICQTARNMYRLTHHTQGIRMCGEGHPGGGHIHNPSSANENGEYRMACPWDLHLYVDTMLSMTRHLQHMLRNIYELLINPKGVLD